MQFWRTVPSERIPEVNLEVYHEPLDEFVEQFNYSMMSFIFRDVEHCHSVFKVYTSTNHIAPSIVLISDAHHRKGESPVVAAARRLEGRPLLTNFCDPVTFVSGIKTLKLDHVVSRTANKASHS